MSTNSVQNLHFRILENEKRAEIKFRTMENAQSFPTMKFFQACPGSFIKSPGASAFHLIQ